MKNNNASLEARTPVPYLCPGRFPTTHHERDTISKDATKQLTARGRKNSSEDPMQWSTRASGHPGSDPNGSNRQRPKATAMGLSRKPTSNQIVNEAAHRNCVVHVVESLLDRLRTYRGEQMVIQSWKNDPLGQNCNCIGVNRWPSSPSWATRKNGPPRTV